MNAMKRFRLKRGISLTALASRLGVSKPYIAQLEKEGSTVSAAKATEIAEELGVSHEELFEPVRFRIRE